MVNQWIQKTVNKPGTLHRQLKIPKNKKIPLTLLNKIIKSKPGDTIINHTKIGKKKIQITRLLEQRAILARNLKKIHE